MFIAALIAFHALLIQPSELDARFGLGRGRDVRRRGQRVRGRLDAARFQLSHAGRQLHILTFAIIFVSLAVSVLSSKVVNAGHERRAWWIDRGAFMGLSSAYVILVAGAILLHW